MAAAVMAAVWVMEVDGRAAERTIGVFVALADNASQGIVPVPAAIGNGDDPDRNLYWGTAEGFRSVFDKSRDWKPVEKTSGAGATNVLRTAVYRHVGSNAVLTARAYRGSAIRDCIRDFEAAVRDGSYDLVAFVGHNGLMDFELPPPAANGRKAKPTDCIVLCCKSEKYFASRLEKAGGRPVLLTTQLMYPGSFLLHAAVGAWLAGASPETTRERAGEVYAANQKISKKAGMGVFAELRDNRTNAER